MIKHVFDVAPPPSPPVGRLAVGMHVFEILICHSLAHWSAIHSPSIAIDNAVTVCNPTNPIRFSVSTDATVGPAPAAKT
jgi:hypothetical protein